MFRCITGDAFASASCLKRTVSKRRLLSTTHSHNDLHPENILQALCPDTVMHLKCHGYAIQDNFLDPSSSSHLRSEINYLISNNLTSPNRTHIVRRHPRKSPTTETYSKRSIVQAEVPHLPSNVSVPYLRILNRDHSLAAYLNVYWPKLTIRDQAVKVQRATGHNGCFPIHIDSSPETDRRIVTALLYPHEHWSHDEGGALRIYNTPISHVDILPVPGRLVLLSSTSMHHRVLSAEHHRFAITLWLSGTLQPVQLPSPSTARVHAQVAYALLQPKYRDFAFRLALQDEWEISLSESHPPEEASVLVEQFRNNLETIRKRLPDALCNDLGFKDGVERMQIEKLLEMQQSVRKCYQELDEHTGEIPFFW